MPNGKTPWWLIFLILVGAIGVLYFLDHRFQLELFQSLGRNNSPMRTMDVDEEERPPVVVSSGGSIIIQAQDLGLGHGELEYDDPLKKNLKAIHHKVFAKGTKSLFLFLAGHSCSENPTTGALYDISKTSGKSNIVLTYGKTLDATTTITISINGAKMSLVASDDFEADANNKYTMYLQHADGDVRILKAVFNIKDADKLVSCDFSPTGRVAVAIYQSSQ